MYLKKQYQGNAKSKDWFDYTTKFCEKSGEDMLDLLGFNLRRLLIDQGEREKAELLKKVLAGENIGLEPFHPKNHLVPLCCEWKELKPVYE